MVLFRSVRLCALLYVSFAVLYTTNYYLLSPLHTGLSLLQPAPRHQNVSADHVSPTEELLLSKAFAQAMRPSKIIPFFYRATDPVDPSDITITTIVTDNRYAAFTQLVERYQGPISVTVHITHPAPAGPGLHARLDALHALYASAPALARRVDVHLVLDAFDRQFNTWRNLARLFARTDFVMLLDVDFAPCTDFRAAVRGGGAVLDMLRAGAAALVVPAFEYVRPADGADPAAFPRDKQALLALVRAGRIGMFHPSWPAGHNSTDYARFAAAAPGEVYRAAQYQAAYEPYVIVRRAGPPWCDERFVGYGGNKAACLFELHLAGAAFFVLADHFVVHQSHAYAEAARRNERKANRRLYAEFKEEACLRYIARFHAQGLLNTTGRNALEECRKVRGVARAAAQLIGA